MSAETGSVLLPRHPPRSRAARMLGMIAVPMFGVVIAIDTVLTAAGMAPAERPEFLRLALALLIAAPALLWLFGPRLASVSGLGWLADQRRLSLAFDASGMTLRRAEQAQTVGWDDISRLVVFDGSFPSAELVLRDGARLKVAGELVLGRDAHGQATTLLDEIARYRPELAQVDARRRQGAMISVAIIAVVALLGLVGLLILVSR